MSSVETLNVMSRKAVTGRDWLVWQDTLAAARRVMSYYTLKGEDIPGLQAEAGSSATRREQLRPESRLAA